MDRLDVRDLLERPGSAKRVRLDEPLPGLATELAEVPADRALAVELTVESIVEGIYAAGEVLGRADLRCARCLAEFQREIRASVREVFVPAPSHEGDEYPLDPTGFVNVEPMVRDALMLEMPFSPLCRTDCRGLCERCGSDLNTGACGCPEEATDPRLAALDAWLEQGRGPGPGET